MNSTDLIAAQTKLINLKKKVREAQTGAKYSKEALTGLTKGEWAHHGASRVAELTQMYQERIAGAAAEVAKFEAKIAELEAQRPEVNRYTEILVGLKGNALEIARNAIEIVITSEEQGYWIPHGSRKVAGLITKKGSGANWAAFKAAVAALDDQRSKATFVVDPTKVSPTVRKTLDALNLNSATIRVCPIEYREVEILTPAGKTVKALQAFLLWPAGTKHGASRFHATNSNFQCQACGHAIRNAFNWVPVLVDNAAGVPHSIWVGRDCAKSLFGIELKGALVLAEGQR